MIGCLCGDWHAEGANVDKALQIKSQFRVDSLKKTMPMKGGQKKVTHLGVGVAAEALVAGARLAENGEFTGTSEDGVVGTGLVAAAEGLAVATCLDGVGDTIDAWGTAFRGVALHGEGGDGREEDGGDGGELHID